MTDTDASAAWCSDALAELLRNLDIGFIALSPGSSFRGLHESLVNLLGNRDPEMLLCLHEEHGIRGLRRKLPAIARCAARSPATAPDQLPARSGRRRDGRSERQVDRPARRVPGVAGPGRMQPSFIEGPPRQPAVR